MVEASSRVGVDDFKGVLRQAEGIAEAGDFDAGKLEFRGVVDAGEHGFTTVDAIGGHLGHCIRGSHEPDAHPADTRHFADRPDSWNRRRAVVTDRYATARAEFEARLTREFVARRYTDREDDKIGIKVPAVRELHAHHLSGGRQLNFGWPIAELERDSLGRDEPPECLAGALIELCGHEPATGMHDRCEASQPLKPTGGFEPEQAAADHNHPSRPAEMFTQSRDLADEKVDVLHRTIDVTTVGPWNRRNRRCGAGREHEMVIPEQLAIGEGDGASHGVDRDDAVCTAVVERG